MSNHLTRAQLLRGDISGRRTPVRPPWHFSELQFIEQCTRCDKCIELCPEQIIQADKKGFPFINFRKGECTFCGTCAQECPTQALNSDTTRNPWSIRAVINGDCLPFRGIVCGRCVDECEVNAISLQLVAGGIAMPRLDYDQCTGCGACYRICPSSAIDMQSVGAK